MTDSKGISGHLKAGIGFSIITFILPVGVYYDQPFGVDSLKISIAFVPAVQIEIHQEGWLISFLTSSFGIFLPILIFAHLYLSYLGYVMAKRESNLSRIYLLLLLVTLLGIFVYFPRVWSSGFQFPLPLALLIGSPLVRLMKPEYSDEPFEECDK